nr:hypothetical protein [Planomonospora sphaerica]
MRLRRLIQRQPVSDERADPALGQQLEQGRQVLAERFGTAVALPGYPVDAHAPAAGKQGRSEGQATEEVEEDRVGSAEPLVGPPVAVRGIDSVPWMSARSAKTASGGCGIATDRPNVKRLIGPPPCPSLSQDVIRGSG